MSAEAPTPVTRGDIVTLATRAEYAVSVARYRGSVLGSIQSQLTDNAATARRRYDAVCDALNGIDAKTADACSRVLAARRVLLKQLSVCRHSVSLFGAQACALAEAIDSRVNAAWSGVGDEGGADDGALISLALATRCRGCATLPVNAAGVSLLGVNVTAASIIRRCIAECTVSGAVSLVSQ